MTNENLRKWFSDWVNIGKKDGWEEWFKDPNCGTSGKKKEMYLNVGS